MKKSKGLYLAAVILAAMLFLTACDTTRDKKPYNFPGSLWVCQELPACIAVTEQEAYSYGEIELDGKVISLTMVYMIANEGAFLDFHRAYSLETIWTPNIEDDKYLWRGVVTYSRTEFTLEATAEGRGYPLRSDDDLPLTFVRHDAPRKNCCRCSPGMQKEISGKILNRGNCWNWDWMSTRKILPKKRQVVSICQISGLIPSVYRIENQMNSAHHAGLMRRCTTFPVRRLPVSMGAVTKSASLDGNKGYIPQLPARKDSTVQG